MSRIIGILMMLVIMATACVREPKVTYDEIEHRSLKAWIEKYHPELMENYQEDGGYYVEILEEGDGVNIVTGKDVWVWFDFTARDLQGNIHETRSADIALQLATYSNYAHYVPAVRFSGKDSHTLMEGTYLATYNPLKIGNNENYQVSEGTKLRLYLPSSVTNTTTDTSDGGYEGQFEADKNRPMIVDMTIYGHVENPVEYEGERVESFAMNTFGLCEEHKVVEEESAEKSSLRRHTTRTDEEGEEEDKMTNEEAVREFYDGRWHQPVDTLEHLLVNYTYNPEKSIDFAGSMAGLAEKYPNQALYTAGKIYNDSSDLESRINAALIARFGKGATTEEEYIELDSLRTQPMANVWYIGRFLDGFIFDTNIDEVKEIIYGEVKAKGEALTFNTRNISENSYILAWNYSIPTLRYGQWASILTVSTYGYGIAGKVGSHTTTTNYDDSYYDYANYYNYMNYMNNYYGYGYGGMYNNGYYGYNPYYYGYNQFPSSGSVTTTTTTSTEIPAYSPLLFQIYVTKP